MQASRWLVALAFGLSACQPSAVDFRRNDMTMNSALATSPPVAPAQVPPSASKRVAVLDSFLAYREQGSGPPVVFLHGNPLSSRVWRDVLPAVAGQHRCLAPDLIGMGDSGKPNIAYRFADHARYLDAWFEALGLREVVLVGYDWGGALAMDWAARHPERARGLVVFETFLRPMQWSEWSPKGKELFSALRTPGVGEPMVLGENQFLARSLANGMQHPLTEEDRAAYYAPYVTPESRRPLLQWTREIPIENEPADVAAVMARYDDWLASATNVPKLLLAFDSPPGLQPSPTGSKTTIDWARQHVSQLEVETLGVAGHHAPEDRASEIGQAVDAWLKRHQL